MVRDVSDGDNGYEAIDWARDYDIFHPDFVADPYPIYERLRRSCPVAHTERHGGSWLPTRYDDIVAIAYDTENFSSCEIGVVPRTPPEGDEDLRIPPIDSDPPAHATDRRLILPFLAPNVVQHWEPVTRELCRTLLDGFSCSGRVDASMAYAGQVPVRVISRLIGVDESRSDDFISWARGIFEVGPQDPEAFTHYAELIRGFFREQIAARQSQPRDDLISVLLASELNGAPVPEIHVRGVCSLLLLAGIDTTWNSIGSALWHLATHPDDRARLVADPSLLPLAVEEFLRAYSPVTMARIARNDVKVNGHVIPAGQRVLLPFPAANRDPEVFPDADRVIIDRAENRHVAFGVGIHRCAGSNLARMEIRVALEEWLTRIPEFDLEDPAAVRWVGGQVRGPRGLPLVFPPRRGGTSRSPGARV